MFSLFSCPHSYKHPAVQYLCTDVYRAVGQLDSSQAVNQEAIAVINGMKCVKLGETISYVSVSVLLTV
jgi:hypothetical protein